MTEERKRTLRLLVALQRGIPLVGRPFAALGKQTGCSEDEVLHALEALFEDGRARRFGAVFDARRLGYRSTLCAARLTPSELDEVIPHVTSVGGVTHCYLRGWPQDLDPSVPGGSGEGDETPNLWFTLATPEATFDADLERIGQHFPGPSLHVLPALRRFKIDVVLDPVGQRREETFPGSLPRQAGDVGPVMPVSEEDKRMVRALQGNLAREACPFDRVAGELGCEPEMLLERLRKWKDRGVLRRVGVILYHRKVGFKANGMCAWSIPDDILKAGRTLAGMPEVTHCYQRPSVPAFPHNLYAMIHTGAWLDTVDLFGRISRQAGLRHGRVLLSLHEYKKSSMVYFPETAYRPGAT